VGDADGFRYGGLGFLVSVTYLDAIRSAQEKALQDDPTVFIYGQDVGAFGGAFKATKNLAKRYPGRVIDSPISEDAMVGMAVGAAMEGMRPIVEMQFADFSTVGLNQMLNHAATTFWRTGKPCPMVLRLPSGGTPGSGPFHSQSMETIYSHYPGIVVMTPATVDDAYYHALGSDCHAGSCRLLRAQVAVLPLEGGCLAEKRGARISCSGGASWAGHYMCYV